MKKETWISEQCEIEKLLIGSLGELGEGEEVKQEVRPSDWEELVEE